MRLLKNHNEGAMEAHNCPFKTTRFQFITNNIACITPKEVNITRLIKRRIGIEINYYHVDNR